MPDGVRDLHPPPRFEVRHQVELAAVIGAVMEPAQRDNAERVDATGQRAGDEMRIDPSICAAHEAAAPSYSCPLSGGAANVLPRWSACFLRNGALARNRARADEAVFASSKVS